LSSIQERKNIVGLYILLALSTIPKEVNYLKDLSDIVRGQQLRIYLAVSVGWRGLAAREIYVAFVCL
jgi:hypothetical protein